MGMGGGASAQADSWPIMLNSQGCASVASQNHHRGSTCPATQNGRQSSIKRAPPTQGAARSSPASSKKSPSPPSPAEEIPTATPVCAEPSLQLRQKTCPPTISSARYSAAPAN